MIKSCIIAITILATNISSVACSKVLLPLVESGDDVALIVIAGQNFTYDQYELLGISIQQSASERLWVQLSDAQYQPNSTVLQQAKYQLYDAGFPYDGIVFGGGHGQGADIAIDEVSMTPDLVDALVIFSTGGSHERESFPVSVLTVNGDLDGDARVTVTAKSFSYVKLQVENGDITAKLTYPHKIIDGVNHAQYCTGELPYTAEILWIEPEVSDTESRRLIGESMAPFIDFYSTQNQTLVEESHQKLLAYYDETEEYLEPIFTAFQAEMRPQDNTSVWVKYAQYRIADLDEELVERLWVNTTVIPTHELSSSRAGMYVIDNEVYVTAVAAVTRQDNVTLYQAADMIEMKGKRSSAILEALGEDPTLDGGQNVSVQCRDVNQDAFDWVWNELIPEKQKERYLARNISIEFLDDVFATTGPMWVDSQLLFDFDGFHLDIQSTNLLSPVDFLPDDLAGAHYCKALSPAKALEFIYVDSLYESYYKDDFYHY